MLKYEMIGKKFSKWLVLKRASPIEAKDKKRSQWHCICECGVEKVCDGYHLRTGQTKSCGCFSREQAREKRRLHPGESGRNQLYLKYKESARVKNQVFNLDKDFFTKITQKNCHYCNIEPHRFYRNNGGRSKEAREYSSYRYNGIDRKDNLKGYSEDNVVSCCMRCNYMKKDMPYEIFLEIILQIAKNRGLV